MGNDSVIVKTNVRVRGNLYVDGTAVVPSYFNARETYIKEKSSEMQRDFLLFRALQRYNVKSMTSSNIPNVWVKCASSSQNDHIHYCLSDMHIYVFDSLAMAWRNYAYHGLSVAMGAVWTFVSETGDEYLYSLTTPDVSFDHTFFRISLKDVLSVNWGGETIDYEHVGAETPMDPRRDMNAVVWNNVVYIFGGLIDGGTTDELLSYDHWGYTFNPEGNIAPARSGVSMIIYEDYIYLFGGSSDFQKYGPVSSGPASRDLYILPSLPSNPITLCYTVYDHALYVYVEDTKYQHRFDLRSTQPWASDDPAESTGTRASPVYGFTSYENRIFTIGSSMMQYWIV